MGTLLDTTVFIELERALRSHPARHAMTEVTNRLEQQVGPTEDVGIAAITASELLHGVHRAAAKHRPRREAFIEAVLAAFPPLPFDLLCARAHDRLVAATAISAGWRVGTGNVRHFQRIHGLDVIAIQLSE